MKFTPEGSVTLSVRFVESPPMLEFAIKDTGVGIPEEKQKIIFEAFKQADENVSKRYGGSGLGLSISKLIADKMGGSISVYSDGSHGSTFTFRIPYVPAKDDSVLEQMAKASPEIVQKTELNLLLVEVKY